MRCRLTPLLLVLMLSGCLLDESEGSYKVKPYEGGLRVVKEVPVTTTSTTSTSSTTTSSTTSTTHQGVPIKPLDGLLPTTTTASTSSTTSTTTTSTSTTTTVTLVLKRREYASHDSNSFYLKEIEYVGGVGYYTMDYNTSDDRWDTVTFTDKILVDDLEVGVLKEGPKITLTIYIRENEWVKNNTPLNATPFMLGGGLINRTFGGYEFSLDSLHSNRIKLKVSSPNESRILELYEGDVAYYRELEVGVLDTRVSGGYAIIYVMNDSAVFRDYGGVRYCSRDYVRYVDAKSMILDAATNVTYGGWNLTVRTYEGPIVTIGAYSDKIQADLDISCGSTMMLYGRRFNLMWIGDENGGSVKLVAHT
jgi:hypothetical protein